MGIKLFCLYCSSLNDWRGTTAGLKNLLSIFKSAGVRTDLYAYDYYYTSFDVEREHHHSLLDSTTFHLPEYLPKILKSLSLFIMALLSFRDARKSDVLFAELSFLPALLTMFFAKLFDKPVVYHYIDEEPHPIPEFFYKQILKNADAVLAISPYLMKKSEEYGAKHVIYLPPFVDTELFKTDQSAREAIRNEMRMSEHDVVLGYAGSFAKIEGLPILLQTLKNLGTSHPELRLLMLGANVNKDISSDEDNVPGIIEDLSLKDKVIRVPPKPHSDVPAYLSACDILCCSKLDCPTNRAANPIKIVEYLSMAKPVVSSSVGGVALMVDSMQDGLLVKPGSQKELEEGLEKIINNPLLAKKLASGARRKAEACFSFNAIKMSIIDTISEVL